MTGLEIRLLGHLQKTLLSVGQMKTAQLNFANV